jgi:uncharacterized protein (TIGR00251 family)
MTTGRRRASRQPESDLPPVAVPAHLAIRPTAGGTLLSVRVVPRASRTGLDGWVGDALRVRLTAPPVEGAANAALLNLLADRLGLPKSAVTLASGATNRQKVVRIEGLTPAEVRARLGTGSASR